MLQKLRTNSKEVTRDNADTVRCVANLVGTMQTWYLKAGPVLSIVSRTK